MRERKYINRLLPFAAVGGEFLSCPTGRESDGDRAEAAFDEWLAEGAAPLCRHHVAVGRFDYGQRGPGERVASWECGLVRVRCWTSCGSWLFVWWRVLIEAPVSAV